ncbi:HEAT repeat domain-containing protein [Aggregatilinea lenta]|uniref:HEAT repeat domain-containing protein n=1 Tax=Aggregatilinea lenta TaxID=913108 RepID=UPI000E5B9F08|nr:HEAT repeat domain-containing protein [Aggregatilinea lenta]
MPLFGPPNIEKMKAKGDVKGLIKAMEHKNKPVVRKHAAQALGEIEDVQASGALVHQLAYIFAPDIVLIAVIEALSPIRDKFTVQQLIHLLRNENVAVRQAAIHAIAQFGDAAIESLCTQGLKSRYEAVREGASLALAQLGDAGVKRLIKELDDAEVREVATQALIHLGDAAAVPLIEALPGEFVAQALVQIGDVAVEPLIATLNTDNRDSTAVAKILGQLGDDRAIEPLLAAAKNHRSVDVREAAGQALRSLRFKPKDKKDEIMVCIACNELDQIISFGASAVEPLIDLLSEKNDYEINNKIIEVFGKLGDKHAIEPMMTLLQEDSPFDYDIFGEALGRLSDGRSFAFLTKYLHGESSQSIKSLVALGWIGEVQAIAPIVKMCHDTRLTSFSNEAHAKSIVHALQGILERNAGRATNEDLRAVVSLDDVKYHWEYKGTCDLGQLGPEHIRVDYIRQLARQELIRRGEHA